MNAQLEELAQYIRLTVPQSKFIEGLQIKETAGVVSFRWQGREFLVKPSLEVFESKGTNVFITGASALMQLAFIKKDKNKKVLEAVLDSITRAEDLIKAMQTENGLKLLGTVKQSLIKLGAPPTKT